MLTVNSTTTTMDQTMVTTDNPQMSETYYTLESDDTNLSVESQTTQESSSSLYTGTVVQNTTDNSTLYIGTVVANINAAGTYSEITGTNNTKKSVKWALISTSGTELYRTPTSYVGGAVCTIDLRTISALTSGIQFKLKAIVDDRKDSTSGMILTFRPDSQQTANFKVTATLVKSSISYLSTTPN